MPLPFDVDQLVSAAGAGDRRALARAISLVEGGDEAGDRVMSLLYRHSGRAWVIGVTGSPGAGKSTLVDRLVTHYRADGSRVAVVAVDPSSPITRGAILGDRIRMQEHAGDPDVFIRSMSSRGHLGGLAPTTTRVVAVLDAVGFDPILVETVGVGQSEIEVAETADTTVVVLTPGMGDGIQTAKAGLLEVGDVFCVNKADDPGTDRIVGELHQMLEMGASRAWQPPVVTTVATEGTGTAELAAAVDRHRRHLEPDLDEDRARRLVATYRRAMVDRLARRIESDPVPDDVRRQLVQRDIDPWSAASRTHPIV